MAKTELTKTQHKVLKVITQYIQENNLPPTFAELSELLAMSTNGARDHVLALARKNVIRYTPNIARGIELLQPPTIGIPIYGTVPAGHPFMSQENIVDSFELQNYLSNSDGIFGLYVKGDSMIDAGLSTGDLVFVDPNETVRRNRMVVALVEGEPTLKWFKQEGNIITLIPANKKYKPIIISKNDEQFKIVGVVIGHISSKDKLRLDKMRQLKAS
ncbi:MAG: repressor LexA [Bacteroidetes bacterium]|nr:repressor LexA [Bacteroidota bacterium]